MSCMDCDNYEVKGICAIPHSLQGRQPCACENYKKPEDKISFTAENMKKLLDLKEMYRKRVNELEARYKPENDDYHNEPDDSKICDEHNRWNDFVADFEELLDVLKKA